MELGSQHENKKWKFRLFHEFLEFHKIRKKMENQQNIEGFENIYMPLFPTQVL